MAEKISAGILLFRINENTPEVLLVHPGGPFWKNKDEGAWSIPKGEAAKDEDLLYVAKKEFFEETGSAINGECIPLLPVVQKGGKKIYAWAVEGDIDASAIVSNTFSMIWPPKSGKVVEFPEIDRAQWFNLEESKIKLNAAQSSFIEQLKVLLDTLSSS